MRGEPAQLMVHERFTENGNHRFRYGLRDRVHARSQAAGEYYALHRERFRERARRRRQMSSCPKPQH
jgi:hypothetical protein